MKVRYILITLLVLSTILIMCPVQAFKVNDLTYTVSENGDANVVANYEMSFIEGVALAVPTVKDEFINAVKNEYGSTSEVSVITDKNVQFNVPKFADKYDTYIQTPCLNFERIKDKVSKYWFIGVLDIDYSPAVTKIVYYDGTTYTYNDQLVIPATTLEL